MDKSNIFRSSPFYLFEGDILHIVIKDESGTPPTINLIETSKGAVEAGTPVPPIALDATLKSINGFTANWQSSALASGYYLDVATDSSFTSFLEGYNNKDVGNVTSYDVSGITITGDFYYRVRAYNVIGTSSSSNTIFMDSYNDWFMPSKDELVAMYNNLYLYNIGGFNAGIYQSSSEGSSTTIWTYSFGTNQLGNGYKTTSLYVRACRKFTAEAGSYSLRDLGQAGGRIFYISGTTHYEAAPFDFSIRPWSNISNILAGTATGIGTGQANTSAIIGQVGHEISAAKDCNDLIVI